MDRSALAGDVLIARDHAGDALIGEEAGGPDLAGDEHARFGHVQRDVASRRTVIFAALMSGEVSITCTPASRKTVMTLRSRLTPAQRRRSEGAEATAATSARCAAGDDAFDHDLRRLLSGWGCNNALAAGARDDQVSYLQRIAEKARRFAEMAGEMDVTWSCSCR